MDAMVNLGCLESAIVTGSVDTSLSGGKHPDDILWNPATNAYKKESSWHEYGLGYNKIMGGVTEENPLWWMVEWPTAKNINYITVTGCYGNQPQPHTGWAIQIDSAGTWKNLAKADNGWPEDTLKGVGGWVHDGLMELKLMQPVVTTKLRFCAFANPDSLANDTTTFADSLWSFSFTGLKKSSSSPNACLIHYLDFSTETAKNREDATVNLALLDEAVVSSLYDYQEIRSLRGHPTDMLWDPATGDFHNPNTNWGEFGMPYQYDAGYLTHDAPYYWMVEWAVPKTINYFTWCSGYKSQPQPTTPWAVEYWDGAEWVEAASGIGTDKNTGIWQFDSEGRHVDFWGIGVGDTTNSTWMSETPIQTTKLRLAVWSGGIDPLWSFHIRGRGGQTKYWDERIWLNDYDPEGWRVIDTGADPIPSTFKAMLVQYRDLSGLAVEPNEAKIATEFALHQNYPNPFNPKTTIAYELAMTNDVELSIYNLTGQKVVSLVSEKQNAGDYRVEWDASGLASGIYYYQLKAGEFQEVKKMVLVK